MLRVEKSQHTHTLGTPPTPTSSRVSLSRCHGDCRMRCEGSPAPSPPDGGVGWFTTICAIDTPQQRDEGDEEEAEEGVLSHSCFTCGPLTGGPCPFGPCFSTVSFFWLQQVFRKLKQSHSIRQRFSPVSALWPEVWRTLLSLPSSSEVCGFTTKYKSAPTNHSRSISPAYVRVGWYLSAIFPTPSSRAHPLTHKNGLGASLSLLRFTARH